MHGLRKFIAVDIYAAVKIGDLEKDEVYNSGEAKVQDRLSGRCGSERRRAHISLTPRMWGDSRRGPPLVDEDWHAIYQAFSSASTDQN